MLALKRHYEYWFAVVALYKLGSVMIPATHMLTVDDFAYRIEASKIKAIVCTAQNEVPEKICAALSRIEMTVKLWCVHAQIEGFEDLSAVMQTEKRIPP